MGCASSTQVVTDPITGQTKTKKKLGGAYPGQRRPQNAPYVPSASQFGKDGTCTAHFVAYGGGNALTLVQQDGTFQPETGKPQPEYIQVTLPEGVVAGQTIHVQAPDGRLNAIIVPPGFGPGSTFTVEFAPEAPPETAAAAPMAETASPYNPEYNKEQQQQQPYVVPPQESRPDDGFASGFGNSNYVPTAAPVYPSAPKY